MASYDKLLRDGLHQDYRHESDFHDWKAKSARPSPPPAPTWTSARLFSCGEIRMPRRYRRTCTACTRARWRKWRPRPARRAVDPKPIATDKLLAARFESSNRLHYVSLIQSLCSPAGCLATLPEDRGLIVVDYGHLSPPGSVYVANHVLAVPLRTVLRLAAQAPEPSS